MLLLLFDAHTVQNLSLYDIPSCAGAGGIGVLTADLPSAAPSTLEGAINCVVEATVEAATGGCTGCGAC